MEADKICLDDANIRVKKDSHKQIIGNYLVGFNDEDDLAFAATIVMIEGARYTLNEFIDILKNELSFICDVEICSHGGGGENFILIESSDRDITNGEFYHRIVRALHALR